MLATIIRMAVPIIVVAGVFGSIYLGSVYLMNLEGSFKVPSKRIFVPIPSMEE